MDMIARMKPQTPIAQRTRRAKNAVTGKIKNTNKKKYNLNMSKAVCKKLQHTDRDHIEIWETGGGIRGKFSAAFFEILKHATELHYQNYQQGDVNGDEYRCEKKETTDQTGCVVEVRYVTILIVWFYVVGISYA